MMIIWYDSILLTKNTTGVTIKKFFYSFIFITLVLTKIQAEYPPMIEAQLDLIHQLDEHNITQDKIKQITDQHELLYINAFEKILLNKRARIDQPKLYQKELVMLAKLIKRNKANGNTYAVLRDEVQMKSYEIIQSQDKMTKRILRGLGQYDYEEFNKEMNDAFVKNQEELLAVDKVDYHPFLVLKEKSRSLQKAQEKIKDYYALLEINADMLKYYSIFEKRVYRLNKYADYYILPIALYLDHTAWVEKINSVLYPYNLSVVKILLILFLSLVIYLIRTRLFVRLDQLLTKVSHDKYSRKTMEDIQRPLNILFLIINLQIVIYIYNNFYSIEVLTKVFNITYSLLFTLILYRIINSIAGIRLDTMDHTKSKIKNEMVNVGMKIINFLILIMGILLVMHFAGANLTAVLSGLGIGGFAIALAARESLSNFFGTISILLSDVFSQGDWIVVDGQEGTVVEIGLRVTTLRTFDNALIALPNGIVANQDVKNWNKRTLGRRIKMSLGVKYDSKPENIRNAIIQIREMLATHPGVATSKTDYKGTKASSTKLVSKEDSLGVKRTLLVFLDELSDSSINILVYCFSKTTDWEIWLETKEDVIFKMMDILAKNDLEFAFPSLSIYKEDKEL